MDRLVGWLCFYLQQVEQHYKGEQKGDTDGRQIVGSQVPKEDRKLIVF